MIRRCARWREFAFSPWRWSTRQLLLGGGAGTQTAVVQEEGEKPAIEIVPESSENDASILPKDQKGDVEVVINNALDAEKVGVLPENEKDRKEGK